jgi:hypothetical protein
MAGRICVRVPGALAGDAGRCQSDAGAEREVQAEADILHGLRHPNVVLPMAVRISHGQQVQNMPVIAFVIAKWAAIVHLIGLLRFATSTEFCTACNRSWHVPRWLIGLSCAYRPLAFLCSGIVCHAV